jgi:hypothetical protein
VWTCEFWLIKPTRCDLFFNSRFQSIVKLTPHPRRLQSHRWITIQII